MSDQSINNISKSKKMAIAGLICSLAILILIVFARILNGIVYSGYSSRTTQYNAHLFSIVVAFIVIILAVIGFILSLTALIQNLRKPAVYGGRGLSIVGLIVNGLFNLITILDIIVRI